MTTAPRKWVQYLAWIAAFIVARFVVSFAITAWNERRLPAKLQDEFAANSSPVIRAMGRHSGQLFQRPAYLALLKSTSKEESFGLGARLMSMGLRRVPETIQIDYLRGLHDAAPLLTVPACAHEITANRSRVDSDALLAALSRIDSTTLDHYIAATVAAEIAEVENSPPPVLVSNAATEALQRVLLSLPAPQLAAIVKLSQSPDMTPPADSCSAYEQYLSVLINAPSADRTLALHAIFAQPGDTLPH